MGCPRKGLRIDLLGRKFISEQPEGIFFLSLYLAGPLARKQVGLQ